MRKLPSFNVLFRRWLKKERFGWKQHIVWLTDGHDIQLGAHLLASLEGLSYSSPFGRGGEYYAFATKPFTRTTFNAADPDFFAKVKRHIKASIQGIAVHLEEVNKTWEDYVIRTGHIDLVPHRR